MIRKDAKLNSKLFDPKIEQVATRNGFGTGVVEAAKRNKNIVVLCADLTDSTRSKEFKKLFPDRFIQMGVHEQLLASLGAGLALAGKMPFITSYAMFCPGRAWEQIRTNICLNDTNVKIIGSHAGVSVGPDGATHQAIEDIAIMRPIPNMTIIAPCDAIEAHKATVAISKFNGPCYVRYTREKTPVFTTKATPFKIGQAITMRDGKDVTIIACGPLVYNALKAAEALKKEKINCMVINSHTIKPLDEKTILAAAKKCGAIVTVEEHQITGGLGGAVAEYLVTTHPVPMEFIGVPNVFGESGEPNELIEHFGMGVESIKKAVKNVIKKKK
ncbi:MAG: transketolase family protein [Patescibacteria group bacterium]|nr:transketolase family protein [Patescibacteria group bacterium]MBU2509326.1 transketolase family protein [Patescibacteria group bacterium]